MWLDHQALTDPLQSVDQVFQTSASTALAAGDIAFANFRQRLQPFIEDSFNALAVQARRVALGLPPILMYINRKVA